MRFPALQSKDFVHYTAGNTSAMTAIWINRVIIGWLGWEMTLSAGWVGLLAFFLFGPTLIASPMFGVLIDRMDARKAGLISQTTLAITILVLLILQLTGTLTIWGLAVTSLAIGIITSADRTVRFVLVPRIVDKDALANAVSIHGINFNTARLIGPAIGGLLIDIYGTDVATMVNLVMGLPSIYILTQLKVRERNTPKGKKKPFFLEMLDGAIHAFSLPIVREAMILTTVLSLTARGVIEILPAIADGVYGRGASGLGQMLAAAGAGALLAAIMITIRRSGSSKRGIPVWARISTSAGLIAMILLGIFQYWPLAMGLITVLGFCITNTGVDLQASIQLELGDDFRARVMSLWIVLVIGGAALSSIMLGLIADLVGMQYTLIGGGIVGLVLVVFANKLIRKFDADQSKTT